ncbi:MAG: hypothetical protein KC493_02770 [Bacteriovoracaceae bacterium]|nr:hypothetical protein [Bacteriovoracaceae bacterium]
MKVIYTTLLVLTLSLGGFAWSQQMDHNTVPGDSVVVNADDQTTAYTNLQLTDEQYKKLARGIFNVINGMSEKFFVSDSVGLSFYIFRYLSEIGEYEIVYKDMITLIDGFLKLAEYKLDDDVWSIVHQIRKLKFGKKNGKFWVKIFAKDKKNGIRYNIDSDMGGNKVKYLTISNGAEATFADIKTTDEKKNMIKFVKKKVRFLLMGLSSINQVHEGIARNIQFHLSQENPVIPIKAEFSGMKVRVVTKSIFKTIDFKLRKAYSIPGLKDGDSPLPSVVLLLKEKLMPLKISIDQ